MATAGHDGLIHVWEILANRGALAGVAAAMAVSSATAANGADALQPIATAATPAVATAAALASEPSGVPPNLPPIAVAAPPDSADGSHGGPLLCLVVIWLESCEGALPIPQRHGTICRGYWPLRVGNDVPPIMAVRLSGRAECACCTIWLRFARCCGGCNWRKSVVKPG